MSSSPPTWLKRLWDRRSWPRLTLKAEVRPASIHRLWQRYRAQLTLALVSFIAGALLLGDCSCGSGSSAEDARAADDEIRKEQATIWTCSMHPQIRQAQPGQCPICGMDLIPVSSGNDDVAGEGRSERANALAKLRATEVRRRSDSKSDVRLLGRMEPSETTLRTVTAWTGGRLDRLHVNVTGERVRAGQAIATLYSPEVFAAHQDLLSAKAHLARLSSGGESSRVAAGSALDASRERLRLLGVPDVEIKRMESAERPTRAVTIRTPFTGTVIERIATEGAYVTTGAPLYRVADLRKLWLQLDAYESDLAKLAVHQAVRISVDAFRGEEFQGEVTFIEPTLDPRRRTARVRVEVDNKDGRLSPGMFADAIVEAGQRKSDSAGPLVIPTTAPLFTGRRSLVYVEVEADGRVAYEPRTVRLGPRMGAVYPVVAGLSEGERVVTRGAFAIDADLQIRGGASMMTAPDDSEAGAFDEALDVPRKELKKLAPVVSSYLAVQRALAMDDLPASQGAAQELQQHAVVELDLPAADKAAWEELSRSLAPHARHVELASSLEEARAGFEALSREVTTLLRRFGNPLETPLVEAFCSMAFGSRGASWIQQGEPIDNAYFGASMRTCGEVKQHIEPTTHLPSPPAQSPAPRPTVGHQH